MLVSDEPNVEILRQKAKILESENLRLIKKTAELMRENLRLKGLDPKTIELNLPGLLNKLSGSIKPSDHDDKAADDKSADDKAANDDAKKPKKKHTGHGPTEQKQLEIVEKTYALDDADKQCPECGGELKEWKDHADESEVVDVIEHKWRVIKQTQKKYRCKCGHIESADAPAKLIKGGRYTANVAIHTAVAKYLDGLPLDRQVRIDRRQGAKLTSQTLWDQIYALSKRLEPLVGRIKAHILAQAIVGADESPFKLIEKGGAVKWQAWQLSCPEAIYFEIHDSKSAEAGAKLLQNYSGTLVTDGAKVYESLQKTLHFTLVNCWSHALRKVLEAKGEAPGQVAQFAKMVSDLYDIEEKAVRGPPDADDPRGGYRHRLDLEKLKILRDTESRVVVMRIHDWILEQKCVPGGLLKAKLEYVANRWTALTRFLDDPAIPLDNNRTEASYIGLAIGRRNYIGARSTRGTEVAATFYTIFESARVCGIDGEAYLRYATTALLANEPTKRILLPHEWRDRPQD